MFIIQIGINNNLIIYISIIRSIREYGQCPLCRYETHHHIKLNFECKVLQKEATPGKIFKKSSSNNITQNSTENEDESISDSMLMEFAQKICKDNKIGGLFQNTIEAKKIEEDFKSYRESAEQEKLLIIAELEKCKKEGRDARNNSISYKYKMETLQDELNKKE